MEYLVDLNATQAAIRAGYSKRTARAIGAENLSKPIIRKSINEKIEEILENKTDLTLRTIRELERLGFSNISDFLEYDNDGVKIYPSDTVDTRAVSQIKVTEQVLGSKDSEEKETLNRTIEFKLHNKEKALELLSRYLGIYRDLHEHMGKNGGPIELSEFKEKLKEKLTRNADTKSKSDSE